MIANLVQIGNSKGVFLAEKIIEQFELKTGLSGT